MTNISLRVCLWTDMDIPAGPRLFRSPPHPDVKFSYPCTKEGLAEAREAAARLQAYLERASKKANNE